MLIRSPISSRGSAGFTLVELLIGVTLAAAMMASVLSSYVFLGRGLSRLLNQQTLEVEARRTLATFTQDVQAASGISGTPSNASIALTVPVGTGTGSNTITYYYNSGSTVATPTISGSTVNVPATSLVRCVYDGTNLTTLTLLRNITDNDSTTSADLFFRYYDSSGNPYDNGSSPYTTVTSYAPGIKTVSLQFSTQVGNSTNGTQTSVYQISTGRLVLRNKALLQ